MAQLVRPEAEPLRLVQGGRGLLRQSLADVRDAADIETLDAAQDGECTLSF